MCGPVLRWTLVQVEKIVNGQAHVLYINYGNFEVVPSSKLAAVPPGYSGLPPQGREYRVSSHPPMRTGIRKHLLFSTMNYGQMMLNMTDNSDLGEKLIREGLVRAERQKERRLAKLVADYVKVEEEAGKKRRNMWCYSDFTPDDACACELCCHGVLVELLSDRGSVFLYATVAL